MKKKIITLEPDLLSAFVEKQLASHVPPERRGVAKGDSIGLSRVKFETSLAMLTTLPHKFISDEIGPSVSLIRKWRCEDRFKKQIRRAERDFAMYVVNAVKQLNDINLGYLAMYYDLPEKENYTAMIDLFEQHLPDGSPREDGVLVRVEPTLDLDMLTEDAKLEILRQVSRIDASDILAVFELRKRVVESLLKDNLYKNKDLLIADLYTSLSAMKIVCSDIIAPLSTKKTRTPKETEFLEHINVGILTWVTEMVDAIAGTFQQDTQIEKITKALGVRSNE